MLPFITAEPSAAGTSILDDLAADWLPRVRAEMDPAFAREEHEGKSILVTGAGGWIGAGLGGGGELPRALHRLFPRPDEPSRAFAIRRVGDQFVAGPANQGAQ